MVEELKRFLREGDYFLYVVYRHKSRRKIAHTLSCYVTESGTCSLRSLDKLIVAGLNLRWSAIEGDQGFLWEHHGAGDPVKAFVVVLSVAVGVPLEHQVL